MEGAARVYTICDESRYVLVKNVPALGCANELLQLLESFGHIEEYSLLDDEQREAYTESYWVKFADVADARNAKKSLDEFQFFGNLLQVSYDPRYESLEDTKLKLEARRMDVITRKVALQKEDVNARRQILQGELRDPLEGIQPLPHFPLSVACEAPHLFHDPSMSAAATSVRNKLDKLSRVPGAEVLPQQSKDEEQGSFKPASKKPRRRI